MGEIIKSCLEVIAQHPELFNHVLKNMKARIGDLVDAVKQFEILFLAYLRACDYDFEVVDGITSYTEADIEADPLGKLAVVFGYGGSGLIGLFIQEDGDPLDLGKVTGLEIMAKFDLKTISAPEGPFVQLRVCDIVDGKISLGKTYVTFEGIDVTTKMLMGSGLDMIARLAILGLLPKIAHYKQ